MLRGEKPKLPRSPGRVGFLTTRPFRRTLSLVDSLQGGRNMRLGVLLAAVVVMTGCATGMPLGGRVLASGHRYAPLTPVAAPRAPLSVAASPAPRKQVRPPPPAGRRE